LQRSNVAFENSTFKKCFALKQYVALEIPNITTKKAYMHINNILHPVNLEINIKTKNCNKI